MAAAAAAAAEGRPRLPGGSQPGTVLPARGTVLPEAAGQAGPALVRSGRWVAARAARTACPEVECESVPVLKSGV